MLLTHRGSLGRLSLCNVKCPLTPPSATPPDAGQSTALVPPSFISVWGRCTVYPVAPVQLPDTAAKSSVSAVNSQEISIYFNKYLLGCNKYFLAYF